MVRALKSSGAIDVVAAVADGRAALDAIREHRPDVAVVDYKMPGIDGVAVANAVMRDELPTKVLLVSAFEDSSIVYEALASGAMGFLGKEAPSEQVIEAVRRCARGEEVLPPELARGVASEVRKRARGSAMVLTQRELEVVRLIAEGLSVPVITGSYTCRRPPCAPTSRSSTKSSAYPTGAPPLPRRCDAVSLSEPA
jgi:two-component system nitrate/nitrite response regulator NarL